MSTPARAILKAILILLLPLIVIISAVQLLTTDQYLGFEYGKASFPPDAYGFTKRQRFDLASTDIHYIQAHLPEDTLSRELLAGRPIYNAREVGHMADVRAVFQTILRAWQLGFVLLLLLAIALWRSGGLQEVASAVRLGGIFTVAIITGVALLAVLAWQTWFDLFHRLFFAAGSWLFSYSDALIRLFPIRFWFDATVTISLFSLAGGLLLALIGWRGKRLQAH